VGRIIARPFVGPHPRYERTPNRRDYPVSPPGQTLLDALTRAGHRTFAIGKISDIFNGQGIGQSTRVKNNTHTLEVILEHLGSCPPRSFLFANLNDFDSKYGHRNDPVGYAHALEEYDAWLSRLFATMKETDLFMMAADHGCDPCDVSTDHTREYVPIAVWARGVEGGDLGVRQTFSDVAATVAQLWSVPGVNRGASFADRLTGDRSSS
jgi:phosphopentomutase